MTRNEQINKIRAYLIQNKLFSELRGFNAGVRMFDDKPKPKKTGERIPLPKRHMDKGDMPQLDSVESYYKRKKTGAPLTPDECQYIAEMGQGKGILKSAAGLIESDAWLHSKEYNDYLESRRRNKELTDAAHSGGSGGW
jgi:hypothetical protein